MPQHPTGQSALPPRHARTPLLTPLLLATLGITGATLSPAAFAVYPVTVDSSVPVTTEVMPALSSIEATLGEIEATQIQVGTAINQNGDKIAALISQTASAQRDYSTFSQETGRLETARRSYTVPDSICSESASGVATAVSAGAKSLEGQLAGGSGIQDAAIKTAVSGPPVDPTQEQYQAADIHKSYCSAADYAAWGGTALCPAVSELPGGDTEVRSVLYGAGATDKVPTLTFSQAQTDAAMMYLKNASQRAAGKQLSKGEVATVAGKQYAGLMDQYHATQSAASQPALAMVAASQPTAQSKDALTEDFTTPSAKAYFDQTASPEAKRTGEMSERELESFEVGRRYANTDYQTDLQAMDSDNLTREAIRVASLETWLLLGIKQQLQENGIIAGQQLGLADKQTTGPELAQRLSQVAAGVSKH